MLSSMEWRTLLVDKDYELSNYFLGKGSYGTVYLGVHRPTRELVAIKLLPRGDKCDQRVKRELRVNLRLCHPHIVRFRQLFLTDTHLAMVFDWCCLGNLQQYVGVQGPLPEAHARYFFQQLILAVSYMHAKRIVNRDIKLENAMLHKAGDNILLKLTDFGYAKASSIDSSPRSRVGTPSYAAPEVITCDRREYDGKQADVWSCGIFLYVLLFNRLPFERPDDPHDVRGTAQILQRTINCEYLIPEDISISSDCRHLIGCMLVKEPHLRIRVDAIIRHPFFQTDLPASANCLNAECLASQMSEADLTRNDKRVCDVWEEAREEAPQQVPLNGTAYSARTNGSSQASLAGFEQALQQEQGKSMLFGCYAEE